MGLLPRIFRVFVDDKVSGNVTIVPQLTANVSNNLVNNFVVCSPDVEIYITLFTQDFKALFSNPTSETLGYWILKGEQSTWPALAMIRNRCIIDLALDRSKFTEFI